MGHATANSLIRACNSQISTLTVHADDYLSVTSEISPPIAVTSTYRIPEKLGVNNFGPETHIYTRESAPVRSRVEAVLGAIHDNGHAVTYASGLAATFAFLLYFKPKRIALGVGYHGTRAAIDLYQKRVAPVTLIKIDDPYHEDDLIFLENPVNPTGEVVHLYHYGRRAHAAGATLLVDATAAPPPLQQPFRAGAHFILHSSAKYLSGHSDVMGGVIVSRCCEAAGTLRSQRTLLGSFQGSLESWLLLRSLRTLDIRVRQQSRVAAQLASWLQCAAEGRGYEGIPVNAIAKVQHASLQILPKGYDVCASFPHGFGAVFTVQFTTEAIAKQVPNLFRLTANATSFGGVHSTVEWRYPIDQSTCPRSIRVSVGLEAFDDLKCDWVYALTYALHGEAAAKAKL
ncbi:hypothetical protein IWQ60_008428 [Tieghemiomyces parasiticus]|uniref:Cystathionine gamma-synthase n=1 Tax=Tieghemiomyces parasiticus TaxID=78921 RepID=A0A9W8DN19_9FUNG|nr:hypothetical protein IWQ60_008428 [Tieghemiomyces parasiticus]